MIFFLQICSSTRDQQNYFFHKYLFLLPKMAIFTAWADGIVETNSISSAKFVDNLAQAGEVTGSYKGQEVRLHGKSLSAIELAEKMDGLAAAKTKQRTSIKDRKIESKNKIKEKEKILSKVAGRLGPFQDTDKYKNFESTLRRLMNRSLLEGNQKSEGKSIVLF
jgi:succinate dehydrogenase/fumarate reductase flavoprotein subunit